MILIIVSLIAGIFLGWRQVVPERLACSLGRANTLVLFGMLFLLGAQIGGNSELLDHIAQLGGRAFIIALLSTVGSVMMLWLVMRGFRRGGIS